MVVLTENAVFISKLVISFALYSLLGWACESTYCSIPAKRFINRGFLNGPFCPVYGVGALLVIFLLRPFTQNLLVLFVFGVLVTSVLEYITGFLLEKLFHTTWWDYSKRKFNIKGRVCLRNSLLFGVLSVLLLHFINPFVEKLEAWIPEWALPAIAFVFLFYFITDSVITVRSILAMNGKLDELEKVLEEIKIRARRIGNGFSKALKVKSTLPGKRFWSCRPHLLSASRNEWRQSAKGLIPARKGVC